MSQAPSRPTLRARYDRRRQRVVTEAARVFARDGYEQTTMATLANRLGVAAGGLYHYFGSKEELLIKICDDLMRPLLAEARELSARDEPAADQLRALIRIWVEHVVEHRDHMLVFQQERHAIEHGAQWKAVRAERKAFEHLLETVLERGRAEGALPHVDQRLAVASLLGMVNHTAQWYRPRGRLNPQEVADGFTDLILGAHVPAHAACRTT